MNESLVTLMYSSDDDNRIILTTNPNLDMCQREYVNANYVDVSLMLYRVICMSMITAGIQ